MSEAQISKYFEVRLFSLIIMAIVIFSVLAFLFFLFMWRGQYLYALGTVAAAVLVLVAAIKLWKYVKTSRAR